MFVLKLQKTKYVGEAMPLIQLMTEQIRRHNMVAAGDTVVVAVSGGPDSISLLHILYRLREILNINLVVAHLNHQFRDAESDADACFVREIAKCLHIEAYIESRDVSAYCKRHGVSAQVGAREVRYNFLSEVAVKTGASRIALGHHADDQAETILLHLIRGAGSGGLKGMLPVRDNFFIRPLLAVRRRDIETYCKYHRLATRQDSSNAQTKYMRNRVRFELMPLLESKFNANLVDSLNRLGEICRDEDDYLEKQSANIYYHVRLQSDDNAVVLDKSRLLNCHLSLLRRVVRRAWSEICGDKDDLSYGHIEQILKIINDGGGYRQINLPRGVTCKNCYNQIEFTLNRDNEEIPFYQHSLKIPGITAIPELGIAIGAQILPAGKIGNPTGLNSGEVLLDYDHLSNPLVVRRRLAGDRFRPLGMEGTVKIKKFFIDQKISRFVRGRIPLVVSGNNIVWVVGLRPGENYKVTDDTSICLRLYINDYDN